MALYSFRHLFIIFALIIIPCLWAFNLKKSDKIKYIYYICLFEDCKLFCKRLNFAKESILYSVVD